MFKNQIVLMMIILKCNLHTPQHNILLFQPRHEVKEGSNAIQSNFTNLSAVSLFMLDISNQSFGNKHLNKD